MDTAEKIYEIVTKCSSLSGSKGLDFPRVQLCYCKGGTKQLLLEAYGMQQWREPRENMRALVQ